MPKTPSNRKKSAASTKRMHAQDKYDAYDGEKERDTTPFAPKLELGEKIGARHIGHKVEHAGGKPRRENEPPREDPPREDTPTPSEPPEYRDEPPPEERAGKPLSSPDLSQYQYDGGDDNYILHEEVEEGGVFLRSAEYLPRNRQKARKLSQDDVEEWQNKGTPAQGRSSPAFEEEMRQHGYHDEAHEHPHWYRETRVRRP